MIDHYPALYDAYRWLVPAQFNLAEACVYRWAGNTHEGRNIAVYYEGAGGQRSQWTYTRLSETAQGLANGLMRMQVAAGAHVALVMAPCPEAIAALMAIFSVGAIAVPLSSQASPATLRACLRECGARVAIVDGACAPQVLQAQTAQLKQILGLDVEHDNVISWKTLLARQVTAFKVASTASSSPALRVYAQDTGAAPVGVLLAHAALIGVLPGFVASQNWFPRTGDVFWQGGWHLGGDVLYGALAALYFGRPVVLAPAVSTPQQMLDVMLRYRVSNACLPVQWVAAIAREPGLLEQYGDTLPLRALAVQGLPMLPEAVVNRYQTVLGLTPNRVWGASHAPAIIGESHLKWPGRHGSLGRVYPGHCIRVLDAQGQVCPAGVTGSLVIHAADTHQHPNPVLPLNPAVLQADAGDWVPLHVRGAIDLQGYVWVQPD